MQPGINQKTVTIDETEKETLEAILKEIIINLPFDSDAGDEIYRSDIKETPDNFQLFLFGYEMRALRRFLGKIR
ncbi:MAG: hypothetical protein GY754_30880 [bacterium]|nr:hypothetical protein [bacterium]